MKNSIYIICLFFFLLLFSSCEIQKPIVDTPRNFSIETLSLKEIKLKIFLPIENKNNFSFKVKEANLFLYIGEEKMGKINTTGITKIQANSDIAYPIFFEITTKETLSNLISIYKELGKSKPNLYIKGNIIIKKFPFRKKLNVNYKII